MWFYSAAVPGFSFASVDCFGTGWPVSLLYFIDASLCEAFGRFGEGAVVVGWIPSLGFTALECMATSI